MPQEQHELTVCGALTTLYRTPKDECTPEEWRLIQAGIVAFEEEAAGLVASRSARDAFFATLMVITIFSPALPAKQFVVGLFGLWILAAALFTNWHKKRFGETKRALGDIVLCQHSSHSRHRRCSHLTPELIALAAYKQARGIGGIGTEQVFSPEPLRKLLK